MGKCEIQPAICIARLAPYPFPSLTKFITPVYFLVGETEGSTSLIPKLLIGQNPDSLPSMSDPHNRSPYIYLSVIFPSRVSKLTFCEGITAPYSVTNSVAFDANIVVHLTNRVAVNPIRNMKNEK